MNFVDPLIKEIVLYVAPLMFTGEIFTAIVDYTNMCINFNYLGNIIKYSDTLIEQKNNIDAKLFDAINSFFTILYCYQSIQKAKDNFGLFEQSILEQHSNVKRLRNKMLREYMRNNSNVLPKQETRD